MVRTRVGTNLNRKAFTYNLPIVFNDIIEKLEDAGFVASKSEAVRCALSEWLLIHIDLLNCIYSEISKPRIELSKKAEKLWK